MIVIVIVMVYRFANSFANGCAIVLLMGVLSDVKYYEIV